MAQINRFYQPARGQYISQYIPQQLPTELLLQGLANKQGQYNKGLDALNEAKSLWNVNALPGDDTTYRDTKRKEIESKLDEFSGKDLSNPQIQQEYVNFIRSVRDDENIKSIKNAWDTHQAFLERDKNIKSGKSTDYDPAFYKEYLDRFNMYTKPGSGGFRGDIKLGDPTILAGTDIQKDTEDLFDQIKASGGESIKELSSGISYKNGWKSVGDREINNAVAKELDVYYKSRAGQQLAARFDDQNIPQGIPTSVYLERLSDKDKEEYEAARKTYVAQTALGIGSTFKYSDFSTNKDNALNAGRTEQKQAAVENPLTFTSPTQPGEETSFISDAREANMVKSNIANTTQRLNQVKNFQQALESGSYKNINFNNLSREDIRKISTFVNIPESELNGYISQVKNHPEQLKAVIRNLEADLEYNEKVYRDHAEKLGNALTATLGNKYVGGRNFNEITSLGRTIEDKHKDVANYFKEQAALKDKYQGNNSPEYAKELINLNNKYSKDVMEKVKTWGNIWDSYMQSKGDAAIVSNDVQNTYNNMYGSSQYQAVSANKKEGITYNTPEFDNNGNLLKVNSSKLTTSADKQLEAALNKNISQYEIRYNDGSELINKQSVKKVDLSGFQKIRRKDGSVVALGKIYREVPSGDGTKLEAEEVKIIIPATNYNDVKKEEFKSAALGNGYAVIDAKRVKGDNGETIDLISLDPNKASGAQLNNLNEYNQVVFHKDLGKIDEAIKQTQQPGQQKTIDVYKKNDLILTKLDVGGYNLESPDGTYKRQGSQEEITNFILNYKKNLLLQENK